MNRLSLTQVYIVTGGTAGIGFGITAHLLQHNAAKIYLLSQKEEHADDAIENLRKYGDVDKVVWRQCNLKDLKQTNTVAKQLKNEKQIDAVRARANFLYHTLIRRKSSFATRARAWVNTMRPKTASVSLSNCMPVALRSLFLVLIFIDQGRLSFPGEPSCAVSSCYDAVARARSDTKLSPRFHVVRASPRLSVQHNLYQCFRNQHRYRSDEFVQ